jgi:hypothetical protein
MNETNYIIIKDSKFWTGKGWSDEYPDAKTFKKEHEVLRARRIAQLGDVEIWKDYGYENEERL